ncbi:DEAD/DEAH box helicase [Corynebacterium pseudodiphtheriticum]|uniref:DEAD/DEAH box helicase n=1 Tax=Corynebacterium pseudodiphtheriticum TaxID=37637 RepID=UPI003B5AD5BD
MSSFLLHGLWLPVSGLSLWIERVEGRKIVLPEQVPAGTFPPIVESLLQRRSFRNRARISLRTPKGKDVSLMVPMGLFAPEDSVKILSELEFLDSASPAATESQRNAIAPDLYWLIRMYTGLTKFVQAGRVTIRLSYQAGEWFPQWHLATGLSERGWLSEMIAACPGILTVNNRDLSDELSHHLVHWITIAQLQSLASEPRPYPWHDFSQALLKGQPIRRGKGALLRGLNDWNDSITSVDLQLVVIVNEPPDEPDAQWPIRVQVRSGTDSPQPIRTDQLDHSSVELLRKSHLEAIRVSPMLEPNLDPVERMRRRHDDANAGDWDVYVDTEDVVDFVSSDITDLRTAGFTVMLPRAWSQLETTAKLETREVNEKATQSQLGMDKLVQYNWRLSIGDQELSDDEMSELVNSKSGLIKLRGNWVMADTQALNRISSYMDQLSETATKRAKKRMEKAARLAEMARLADSPDADELAAEAERLRQAYNDAVKNNAGAAHADGAPGNGGFSAQEVTVGDLRELALQSMADEPIEFTGSNWHASLLGGMETPAPQRVEIPDTVHAQLRDYQRRGVDWMYWMSRNNLGAVLADDMGLGKTLQLLSLTAIEKHREQSTGPTLVVAPTSVVGNWAREAAKFVPSLRILVHHGSQRATGDEFVRVATERDLVITSYGTVSRDFSALGRIEWDRVVLDEAQAIKNSSTRASKSVRSLPSRHRIALTGTPVENRLSEMRSIVDFTNPGVLGSASFFRHHFAKPIERDNDEALTDRLRRLTAPFILRRLKTDPAIIDDLPEKTEEVLTVTLSDEQAALYKALVDDVQRQLETKDKGMARRGMVLASLTRMKQICNHPAHYLGDGSPVTLKGQHRSGKIEKLMELVDYAVQSGQRMLVFTQYRAFGEILQPYLSEQLGESVPFLHGGVPQQKRDRLVSDFQADDGPAVMILSLKAGGTGLNLTAASMVVHMDRWWNPAVENQATDRAFRIGQQKNVAVYKMISAGTMEESIQDILDGKTHLAGAIVGEGEGWITELDPQQLAELMSYREQ